MRSLFAVAAFASVLLIPSVGSASSLYDTGVDPGFSSPNIFDGYSGAARFTLANDSILDSASLYIWMEHLYSPTSLNWSIESADGSTSYASGFGATLTNDPTVGTARVYDVVHSTFDLGDLSLDAGDYRLVLSNCGTGISGCGWGIITDGIGSDLQYQPVPGYPDVVVGVGTYAFSIQGEFASAEAPEPSTWMMMGTALVGLGGAAIRKRRA